MARDHFQKQDYNGTYHDAAALTSDTDSAVLNFGTPNGAYRLHRVLDVGTLGTGASLVWILKESADDSTYTEVLRVNITAAGRYVIPIDNSLVEKQYFKTTKDITLGSATSITVTEFDYVNTL